MGKNTIKLEPFSMVNLEDYFKEFNTEIAKYQWPDPFECLDDARGLLQDFIDEMNAGEMLFYSIKSEDGRFIGSVEVHGLSEECSELGVWVIESEQHKGYAYEALSMALDKAFTDFGKDKFYYEADIRNIGSTKLLQKFEDSYEIIKKGLDETVTDSGKELKLQGYILKERENSMHRMYENDDIVVFWNSEKCFHAKQCVHGSPRTFNPNRKPWICLDGSDTKEVWQAISKCPSGALSCLYRHNIEVKIEPENCRSVAFDGDKEIGECDYQVAENGWNIYHTEVQPEYGGRGIARRLVYKVIEESERNKVKINASCSYALKILEE